MALGDRRGFAGLLCGDGDGDGRDTLYCVSLLDP